MFSESIDTYKKLFESFKQKNVLIIGDVMIDSYLWGKVDRISPEAPVPIVKIEKKEDRLGGAANVALNILEFGANPILCAVIGKDKKGDDFLRLLHEFHMSDKGIFRSAKRPTTTKVRVIGNYSQLLRIDEENDEAITTSEQMKLISLIKEILTQQKIDVIVFEDYDKGVISKSLITSVLDMAKQSKIPVIVDPKKKNFNHYKNVSLFKPNLKELRDGLKIELDIKNKKQLFSSAASFQKKQQIDIMLITLSEHGVLVSVKLPEGEIQQTIIPAHLRNIADVSGAGDTLTATAALCLTSQLKPVEIASISNLSGGLVCEHVGVVPINKNDLLNEILMQIKN